MADYRLGDSDREDYLPKIGKKVLKRGNRFSYCGEHSKFPEPDSYVETFFSPFSGKEETRTTYEDWKGLSEAQSEFHSSRDSALSHYNKYAIIESLDSQNIGVMPVEASVEYRSKNCGPLHRVSWINPLVVEERFEKVLELKKLRDRIKKEARGTSNTYYIAPTRVWASSNSNINEMRYALENSFREGSPVYVLSSTRGNAKFPVGTKVRVIAPKKYSGEIVEILGEKASGPTGSWKKFPVRFVSGNFPDTELRHEALEPLDEDIYNPLGITLQNKNFF